MLAEDPKLHCVFNVDTLLRADTTSRSQFYHNMLQDGVMSINEVRSREGLGPVDGGDSHHIQLNTLPLDRMQEYADKVTEKQVTNAE
jgi:phage portal protein BeeE